jgi:hypothetical protein
VLQFIADYLSICEKFIALILRANCKDFGKREALVFGGLRIVLGGFEASNS